MGWGGVGCIGVGRSGKRWSGVGEDGLGERGGVGLVGQNEVG